MQQEDHSFQLEIVSVEENMFSGRAAKLFVTGIDGELEILRNHAALLTSLEPGPVWAVREDGTEEAFVIFGGMLEVQPQETIILADSAIRAMDIDEQAALEAKRHAEKLISKPGGKIDYTAVHRELIEALAKLRIIRKMRG